MIRHITVTFAALMLSSAMLSGCSTVINGATEDIRINLAGTGEALCDVTQPGRRYRVYAPSTFRAMRSPDDLRIHCRAPGNRDQIVILKSELSDNVAYNAANLGLGVAWDATSGAMYNYPEVVLMDFTNIPSTSYPQPDYQDVFDKNPELLQLEQFRPGKPALGSDMGTQHAPAMQPRTGDEDNSMGIMMPGPSSANAASNEQKAPLPPIVAPTAAATSTTTGTTTTTTPGVSNKTTTSGTNTTGTATNGTTSTSGSSSSISSRIFTGKIGTVPAIGQ